MKYTIYQLDVENTDVLKEHKLFESWDILNSTAGLDLQQYEKVYEGEYYPTAGERIVTILDSLFETFNIHRPKDYKGHSISVSDIVELNDVLYYCDSFGWVNINTEEKL